MLLGCGVLWGIVGHCGVLLGCFRVLLPGVRCCVPPGLFGGGDERLPADLPAAPEGVRVGVPEEGGCLGAAGGGAVGRRGMGGGS